MPPTIWHNENMKYRVAIIASLLLACAASPPVQAQPGGRDPAWRAERQPQRDGRLSPEEREQLRRDIRQHGRDVYRDRSRRF
jgi:outer membrane biogenesis lipoprotein LolB